MDMNLIKNNCLVVSAFLLLAVIIEAATPKITNVLPRGGQRVIVDQHGVAQVRPRPEVLILVEEGYLGLGVTSGCGMILVGHAGAG